ncbi:ABC transporter permease [Bacillus sp. CLL-7-23]|uniref:ABC transporter permease n=1 Tax=Bacillus changyiensis TaxID=3004103 RepID=A0ABT4X256_9BACI|nr:ABC transporter permease [Bacillus changyiensis]MDA7026387.1 ABC transporter permease [Bacillus changyiensis]
MVNLIRIEIKKLKLGGYVRGVIIANLIIIGLLWMIGYSEKAEGTEAFHNIDEAFLVIGTFVRAVFIIFGAVLLSKLVISEFKNKTILVLFTYPVNRKKIMAAKLLIVGILTFVTILISNVFIATIFFMLNSFFPVVQGEITADIVYDQVLKIVIFAFGAAGTSLVPIYFGMRKQSISATIISSVIIVMLISSTNPVFSLSSIIYIPLSLAAVGIVLSYLTVRQIEKKDVLS